MKKILIGLSVLVGGCTTLSKDVNLVSEGAETAELKVYRESAFQNRAISLYIGEADKYFLKLRSGESDSVVMDAGKHVVQAKANASPASTIEVFLQPNETTCLKGRPNKKALGALIIPIVGNMVPSFVLDEIECPIEKTDDNTALSEGS